LKKGFLNDLENDKEPRSKPAIKIKNVSHKLRENGPIRKPQKLAGNVLSMKFS
jgi:hypothetical protein